MSTPSRETTSLWYDTFNVPTFEVTRLPSLGSGVILEPQGLPNAPNEPAFPSAILRPGETYRATIDYELRAAQR